MFVASISDEQLKCIIVHNICVLMFSIIYIHCKDVSLAYAALGHKQQCKTILKTNLLDVPQGLGVPAQLLRLEAGLGRASTSFSTSARQGAEGRVEDHLVVADQQLHDEGLVGVVHQRGEGHLGVRLPGFDQRGAEDDAQVAGRHLVLLGALRHPGGRRAVG